MCICIYINIYNILHSFKCERKKFSLINVIFFQAASYYCTRWGFEVIGYKGLETGSRQVVSYALRLDKVST